VHVCVPGLSKQLSGFHFLTDAWTKTLPIQTLQYLEESPDPSVAAISSGLILLAVLSLFVGDRVAGLRRLADL
jgi:putative spermidine/putrescine transport system permease protein